MDKKQLNLFDLLRDNVDFTPDEFELNRLADAEEAAKYATEAADTPLKSDAVQQSFIKQLNNSGLAKDASSKIPFLEEKRILEANKIPMRSDVAFERIGKPYNPNAHFETVGEAFTPDQLPVKAKNLLPDVLTKAEKPSVLKSLLRKYGPKALNMGAKGLGIASGLGEVYAAVDPTEIGTPEQAGEVEAALEPDKNKKLDKYLEAVGTEKPWKIEQLQQAFDAAQNMPIPGLDQSSIGLEQYGPFPQEISEQPPQQIADFARAEVPELKMPEPPKSINIMDLIGSANKSQNDIDLMNALGRALEKISSSMAGTKADYSTYDALQKSPRLEQGAKTAAGIIKQREEEDRMQDLRSPASDLSKQAREMYKAITGKELPPNITAEQLQKSGLPLGTLATMKSSQDSKRELKEMERLQKEQAKDAKIEQRQQNQLQTISKELSKDYGTYASAVTNAEQVKDMLSMIKAGKITPGSADVGLLYKFIKAYDPESVVREGEIKLAQNALSTFDKIRTSAKNIISGDMLTPEFRDSILQLAEGAQRLEQKKFARVKKSRQKLAEKFGVDSDDYNATIYPDVDLGILESKEKNVESTQQQTVGPHGYRVRQNDKTYIWNGSKYVEEK